jgi:putative stress-induced transcription regulator/CGNR zinc finger protein
MDLISYADLAVRLVNSAGPGRRRDDGLVSVESYRALVADRPQLAGKVTANDLEALRLLRDELRQIFAAAARHDSAEVAGRLNALLTRHPIHQQLVSHDGKRWHVHLVDSGSAADRHAAGAIAGLTGLVAESGTGRLGICAAEGCERALIAARAAGDKSYCSDQCAPKANVRALRAAGRGSNQGPASTAVS